MAKKTCKNLPIYEYDEKVNGQTRYYCRPYIDGKQTTIRLDENGNMWLGRDGFNKLIDFLSKIKTGNQKSAQNVPRSLEEAVYLFLESKMELKKKTQKNYSDNFRLYILPYFKKEKPKCYRNIKLITPTDIQDWHTYLNKREKTNRKKLSVRFKQELHNLFSQLFVYLLPICNLQYNPVRAINNFSYQKGTKKEKDFLTEKEFTSIIVFETKKIYRQAFTLIFYTGLRIGELTGLRIMDVDLDKNVIYNRSTLNQHEKSEENMLGTPKTDNSIRVIPLLDEAKKVIKEILEEQPNKNPEDFLFQRELIHSTRKFLAEETIRRRLRNIINMAGIKKHITPHSLRHSFITLCAKRGVDVRIVARIVGHKDIMTTYSVYTHVADEEIFSFNEMFHKSDSL